jgi:hypothetical protein
VKTKQKPKLDPTPAASGDTETRQPIVFKVNVILPAPEKWSLSDKLHYDRFLAAGKASPWRNIEEVPESLKPFIGVPDPPPFDLKAWEAETEEIKNSFSPVNESVEAELLQRQNTALSDAEARNAISLSQSIQQDEFEEQLRRENDAKTARFYEAQPQKRKNP